MYHKKTASLCKFLQFFGIAAVWSADHMPIPLLQIFLLHHFFHKRKCHMAAVTAACSEQNILYLFPNLIVCFGKLRPQRHILTAKEQLRSAWIRFFIS